MTIVVADQYSKVIEDDGRVTVVRQNIFGQTATHTFATEYSAESIGAFIKGKMTGLRQDFIQNVFPNMAPEDREFILTGITPAKWNAMFPEE